MAPRDTRLPTMSEKIRVLGSIWPVPVLIAVKAIGIANTYVAEEGIEVKFAVSIVDLENPEIRSDNVTSTYLHFALVKA